jgi:rod shape determining protein RodA
MATYLIVFSIRNFVLKYVMVAVFAVISLAFVFTVNYAFEDVLVKHQQMRIKAILGVEDDLSGAEYNVNQSNIPANRRRKEKQSK